MRHMLGTYISNYTAAFCKSLFCGILCVMFLMSDANHPHAQTPTPRPDGLKGVNLNNLSHPEEAEQTLNELKLTAHLFGEAKPLNAGLVWRIFHDQDQTATIVAQSDEAQPRFRLPSGVYIVHVSFGYASATRKISLRATTPQSEKLLVTAGALKLAAAIGETPISPSKVSFSVFVPIGSNSEGRLVLKDAKTGDVIRLPEGNYHVVSQYGDSNSIMRSDLKVENSKITEATLNHRAATITVKLVTTLGSEALAGTAFSVLTPGGDVVREVIGAFPQMVLSEGDYVLIARHDGQVYTRDFKVQTGNDREIEVEAKVSSN